MTAPIPAADTRTTLTRKLEAASRVGAAKDALRLGAALIKATESGMPFPVRHEPGQATLFPLFL